MVEIFFISTIFVFRPIKGGGESNRKLGDGGKPAGFVTRYRVAVEGQDYITRRACESVFGSVLESPSCESAEFQAIQKQGRKTPEFRDAGERLSALRRLHALFNYCETQTRARREVPSTVTTVRNNY
jgi:hypothetical protein